MNAAPAVELDPPVNVAPSWSAEASLRESECLQQRHYDQIAAAYEAHYSDASSLEYRRRFIYGPLFAGIHLAGMRVLDAMCGAGQTTEYLLGRNAIVTGLDLSGEVIDSFRARWPECQSIQRSLLSSGLDDNSFDCVAIVGGLHHIHPHVNEALREVHRLLKPGGYICFMEPHTGSFADIVRRFWYKHDRFFSVGEAAIDVDALRAEFASSFHFNRTTYLGNVAFLFVLNSLIFRIPLPAKRFYSRPLMALESYITRLQNKKSSCFVVAQWQKR
jgi:SAM-dependent methyltransferase